MLRWIKSVENDMLAYATHATNCHFQLHSVSASFSDKSQQQKRQTSKQYTVVPEHTHRTPQQKLPSNITKNCNGFVARVP